MTTLRTTRDLCLTCWQDAHPTEYAPTSTREGPCACCLDELAPVVRSKIADETPGRCPCLLPNRSGLPADAPDGAEVDDDPDGMAAELAAELDDVLTARALGYVRPGISLDPGETARDGARWAGMLRGAAVLRAAAVADRRMMPGDLRALADADGIVPDVAAYGPTDSRQRQRELLDVWGGWRASAIFAARIAASREDIRNGDDAALAAGFRGWPGDLAADYDASDERYALSPSGRWSAPSTFPPVYLAGWAPRYTRWHVATGADPATTPAPLDWTGDLYR